MERAADRLHAFAQQAAGEPGLKGKLAKPLADDASLLRGMRPSRIAARLRGEAAHEDGSTNAEPLVQPQQQQRRRGSGGGPNPIVLAAGAFALGLLIAKVVDWRSHAHPR